MATLEERVAAIETDLLAFQTATREKLAWMRKRIAMPNRRIAGLEDQLSQLEEALENHAKRLEQLLRNPSTSGSGSALQNGTLSDQLRSTDRLGVGTEKKTPSSTAGK